VWGGLAERQRRRIRSRLAAAEEQPTPMHVVISAVVDRLDLPFTAACPHLAAHYGGIPHVCLHHDAGLLCRQCAKDHVAGQAHRPDAERACSICGAHDQDMEAIVVALPVRGVTLANDDSGGYRTLLTTTLALVGAVRCGQCRWALRSDPYARRGVAHLSGTATIAAPTAS